jgi:hypothetical protein
VHQPLAQQLARDLDGIAIVEASTELAHASMLKEACVTRLST